MPVKDTKRPFFMYAAEAQKVTGKSISWCRQQLRLVRKKYGIPPYYPVPLLYFCEYMHFSESDIAPLFSENPDTQTTTG